MSVRASESSRNPQLPFESAGTSTVTVAIEGPIYGLKDFEAQIKNSTGGSTMELPDTQGKVASGQKDHRWMNIKGVTEEGTFEGILSPYGNVDLGGDVVEPGAYTKTLKDRGNTVPLLWQHRTDMPIGELALEDKPDGLYCKGKLLMALPEAQRA